MSGALRCHPRRPMFASRHPSTAPEARDCPTRSGVTPGCLSSQSLNHVSHRPDRHHLRAAQCATRGPGPWPRCAQMRQNCASLVRVTRVDHHHRVAEHSPRDGGHKRTSGSRRSRSASRASCRRPRALEAAGSHSFSRVSLMSAPVWRTSCAAWWAPSDSAVARAAFYFVGIICSLSKMQKWHSPGHAPSRHPL